MNGFVGCIIHLEQELKCITVLAWLIYIQPFHTQGSTFIFYYHIFLQTTKALISCISSNYFVSTNGDSENVILTLVIKAQDILFSTIDNILSTPINGKAQHVLELVNPITLWILWKQQCRRGSFPIKPWINQCYCQQWAWFRLKPN